LANDIEVDTADHQSF